MVQSSDVTRTSYSMLVNATIYILQAHLPGGGGGAVDTRPNFDREALCEDNNGTPKKISNLK